jgi:hypothetical protein
LQKRNPGHVSHHSTRPGSGNRTTAGVMLGYEYKRRILRKGRYPFVR